MSETGQRFVGIDGRTGLPMPWSTVVRRFFEKVRFAADGCWLWTGATIGPGYAQFRRGNRNHNVFAYGHHGAWILFRGPIPEGTAVLHSCDNRLCVNPDHLFLGTQQDNVDDMIAKGRQNFSGLELAPTRYRENP